MGKVAVHESHIQQKRQQCGRNTGKKDLSSWFIVFAFVHHSENLLINYIRGLKNSIFEHSCHLTDCFRLKGNSTSFQKYLQARYKIHARNEVIANMIRLITNGDTP